MHFFVFLSFCASFQHRGTMSEANSEPGEGVGVGGEGEAAFVLVEHLADKEQADAVAVGLGRKEGAEELVGGLVANPGAVVDNGYGRRAARGLNLYPAIVVGYAFGRVFDYIYQHLLEEHGVNHHRQAAGAQIEFETNISPCTKALEHHAPLRHQFVEVGLADI